MVHVYKCVAGLDDRYQKLCQEIEKVLDCKGYDDGSYGPVLVRLAWHASGTYDQKTKTGGSNGATMRYKPESTDDANAGLDVARAFLDKIKPAWCSLADLWILASYVFIENSGGPVMQFTPGRTDAKDEKSCPPNGRLPDAAISYTDKDRIIGHIKDVFQKTMGFNDTETVALIAGGHSYGRCHTDRSGFNGPWTNRPTKFTNVYCKRLLKDKWSEINEQGKCPISGKDITQGKCPILPKGRQQWVNKNGQGDLMMLPTDMAMVWSAEWKPIIEKYDKDLNALKYDFGAAFKKLTELGCNFNGKAKM